MRDKIKLVLLSGESHGKVMPVDLGFHASLSDESGSPSRMGLPSLASEEGALISCLFV